MKENDKKSCLKTQTQPTDVFYRGSWIYNHNLDWHKRSNYKNGAKSEENNNNSSFDIS